MLASVTACTLARTVVVIAALAYAKILNRIQGTTYPLHGQRVPTPATVVLDVLAILPVFAVSRKASCHLRSRT
jgi:hypothetical protein